MTKLRRTDWLIAGMLLAVLCALFGLGLDRRSSDARNDSVEPAGLARAATTTSGAAPSRTTTARSGPALRGTTPSGTTPSGTTAATTGTMSSEPPGSGSSTTVAAGGTVTSGPATATAPPPISGPVTAVGDSIMLDIQSDLQAALPEVQVDGLVSRQFESGIGIVQADRAAGTLGTVLVVELGTNGTVTASDFDAMMQAATGVQRVVFVNVDVPRPWEQPDDAVLAAGVARYPGLAVLVDWDSVASGHPEWFTPDQVHLEPAGATALASLIARVA